MKDADRLKQEIQNLLNMYRGEEVPEQVYMKFYDLLSISKQIPVALQKTDMAIRAAEEAIETFQLNERTRMVPADLKELME
jgi:hypothetical protein